jgi:Glyoxalase-like domain
MTSKFTELAIDGTDPNGLARFWCSVLAHEVQDEDDGIVTIGCPMVPEGKNRREQDQEVRRLLDLGARHADVGQGEVSWVVLVDPEGNEFCVLAGRRP